MFDFLDDEALRDIRLDRDDATIVEVFHSNAGVLSIDKMFHTVNHCNSIKCIPNLLNINEPFEMGINISIGTIDFWPNGGSKDHGWCNEFDNGPETISNYFLKAHCYHS
jgi:hypothetical protein